MAEPKSEFEEIEYLRWARLHMGRVRCDLARSNIKSLTVEELGLTPADLELNAPVEGQDPELRALIGRRYGVDPARVVLTGGATMGLYVAYAALLPRGGEMILEFPHYEPLARLARLRGATVKLLDRPFQRRFEIDLEELERIISRNTRVVVLTNLHNPSGRATIPERLMTIGQIARDHGAHVLVSEVYLDPVLADGHKPACAFGTNMISINSLTKAYGLGGLRIGWVVAPESLVEPLMTALDYVAGAVPVPSACIARAALRQADALIGRFNEISAPNRAHARAWAAARGDVTWFEPDGGAIGLLKLPANVDAQALSHLLREKYATLVVPGEFFALKGFIRLSMGMDGPIFREGVENVGRALDEIKRRWR
jgi:aspartate/methionine/tyrosine aminotransferase